MSAGSRSGVLSVGATDVTRGDTPGDTPGTTDVARVPADIRPESPT